MSKQTTLKGAISGVMAELCRGVLEALPASYKADKGATTVSPGGSACDVQFRGYDGSDHECRGIVYVSLHLEANELPRLQVQVSFSAPLREINTTLYVQFDGDVAVMKRAVVKCIAG